MTSLIRWALAFCLLLFVIGAGMAQNTNSGDIRGTVTDSTGAVLAGVKVTVTNIDTGSSKVLSTNNDGLYDTASILPGNYQITFTKDGFQRLVRGPVNLQVGIITVDGPMKVGAISEQVTVTTEAPLLNHAQLAAGEYQRPKLGHFRAVAAWRLWCCRHAHRHGRCGRSGHCRCGERQLAFL